MLWLFVILGAVGLASALQAAVAGAVARRFDFHAAVALVLLAAAWALGHSGLPGWCALGGALLVEAMRRIAPMSAARRWDSSEAVDPPRATEPDAVSGSPPDAPDPAAAGADSAGGVSAEGAAADSPPPLSTIVLLSDMWQLAPNVLVASLRRCGERGARLEPHGDHAGVARVSIGPVQLQIEYVSGPVGGAVLEEAAAQSWEWGEALETARRHVARIVVSSSLTAYTGTGDASRECVLRLHCRMHQALAEFAPVVAILWPGAGRLLPPVRAGLLASEKRGFALAAATAVNFRTFPPEPGVVEGFVCDSIGLDALGLSDLQLESPSEPDESATRDLYALAQWQFDTAGVPLDEMPWPSPAGRWRLCGGTPLFGRSRRVMVMAPPPSADPDAPVDSVSEG